jgi:hypothetical protein
MGMLRPRVPWLYVRVAALVLLILLGTGTALAVQVGSVERTQFEALADAMVESIAVAPHR